MSGYVWFFLHLQWTRWRKRDHPWKCFPNIWFTCVSLLGLTAATQLYRTFSLYLFKRWFTVWLATSYFKRSVASYQQLLPPSCLICSFWLKTSSGHYRFTLSKGFVVLWSDSSSTLFNCKLKEMPPEQDLFLQETFQSGVCLFVFLLCFCFKPSDWLRSTFFTLYAKLTVFQSHLISLQEHKWA